MLLERQNELDQLNQMLQRIRSQGGRAAFVFGEAGIGKSTLIEHFLDQLPAEQKRAIGFCDPYWTPRVLGPVRDLALSLLGPETLPVDEERYFNHFIQQLIKARETVVLVIEDLHWADHRTLDWLLFISRRLSQLPILLIASYRDDEHDSGEALRQALQNIPAHRRQRLPLHPLSLTAVNALSQNHHLAPEALHRITNGNPFFITELMDSDRAGKILPDSVSEILHSRLTTLPKNLLAFLEVISCSPKAVSPAMLQATGLSNIDPLCAHACHAKILFQSGQGFQFRHELVRMATYERILPLRKRQIHAQLLHFLVNQPQPSPQPDLIAHHAEGSKDVELVLKYLPDAAQAAARLGAHREACRHLKTAMGYLEQAPVEVTANIYDHWAYEMSLLLNINDEVIEAREKATDLWRQLGRNDKVSENLSRLSRMYWYRGEPETARRYFQSAIQSLEDLPADAHSPLARVLAQRAQYHMQQEQMQEAILWGEQAYQHALAAEDQEMLAHSLNTLGTARLLRGDSTGEHQLRKSLSISRQQGFHEQAARVYSNLSECFIELGMLAQAEQLLDEGIAFDNRHDLDAWTCFLLGRKAQLRFEQDRYDEARQIAESLLQQNQQSLLMNFPATIVLARVKVRCGDQDAPHYLKLAIEAAQKIGELQYRLAVDIACLEFHFLTGDFSSAGELLQASKSLNPQVYNVRRAGEWMFWSKFIESSFAHLNSAPCTQPFAQFANNDFQGAAETFRQQGMLYLSAWALIAGKNPEQIETAMEILNSLQAKAAINCNWLQSLQAPVLKLRPARSRVTKKHPYNLTRQEQKILSLLIEGLSNNSMAEQLNRSRRTIENHVSSVLSKLQCKNRVEAVLRVQSEPWILPDSKA